MRQRPAIHRQQTIRLALLACTTACTAAWPALASATNGYFSEAYGLKALGMGGAGIAFPQDALAAASNPAGMGLVGDRVDGGLQWFQPSRGARIEGSPMPGFNGNYDGDGTDNYFIPNIGATRTLSPNWTVGVSVYGNGGLATEYSNNPFGALGGSSPGGVDLTQLFLTPTAVWRPSPNQAFGIALNLAYQTFSAYGLDPFANGQSSASPANVTNRGTDSATGVGVKIGWIGSFAAVPCSLGATYQTKTNMGRFDNYEGLMADQGDFDIPSTWGVGVACPVTPVMGLTIAVDYQRINYSDVGAVSNPSSPAFSGTPLGSAGGPGFGWQDMNVYKIGLAWAMNPQWTLRGGWNYGKQPIRADDAFFNILAPGLVETHWTLGATWTPASMKHLEITIGAMYAPEKTLSGPVPAALGGGTTQIRLSETSIGLAAGWRF